MAVLIRKGDILWLYVRSSLAVPIYASARGRYSNGETFQVILRTPETAATRVLETFTASWRADRDGEIVHTHMGAQAGNPKRGQTWCEMYVGPDYATGLTISAGYLETNKAVGPFEMQSPGPGGGEGNMRSVDLANPAAGADYVSQTVPANAIWRVHSITGQLVAAALAASRIPGIIITDGTVEVGRVYARVAETTGQTINWSWLRGVVSQVGNQGSDTNIEIGFPDILLPEAYVLDFLTIAIQGTDDWGDGQMLVEEWLVV